MSTAITEKELRPCFRCGKTARISTVVAVTKDGKRKMYNVFCDGNCHLPSLTEDEAIKSWNARAYDAEMQELMRIKREHEKLIMINIYLGVNEEVAIEQYQIELAIIPRVGDEFRFWSTRNTQGEYIDRYAREKFSGIVTRVEHTLEEKGTDASTRLLVQHIDIYLLELGE